MKFQIDLILIKFLFKYFNSIPNFYILITFYLKIFKYSFNLISNIISNAFINEILI